MTSKSDGTDTYTYVWNEDNQLESVELNSSPVVDYVYDAGSRMLQRSEGSTTTNFHWDGWDLIREEKDDGVDVEVTNYLVPHGEVFAFERDDEWFYLHNDGISSTQLVTDESGAQVGRMVYGAWGETLSSSESVPGVLDVRFVGGLGVRNDAATGLIWMRHRWYDPTLNRFISRDPIGLAGDTNLYRYGNNNPVTFTDHTGLDPEWIGREIDGKTKSVIEETKTMLNQAGMSEFIDVLDLVLSENRVLWGHLPGEPGNRGFAGEKGIIYLRVSQTPSENAFGLFHEALHKASHLARKGVSPCDDRIPKQFRPIEYPWGKNATPEDYTRFSNARIHNHVWIYMQTSRAYVEGIAPSNQDYQKAVDFYKFWHSKFPDYNYVKDERFERVKRETPIYWSL